MRGRSLTLAKRSKRLRKGIESIERQMSLHEEKRTRAREQKNEPLDEYYRKEIARLKREREKKEQLLKRA